jgi:hypothetical protein
LERLHGAIEFDAEMAVAKALVAKRHVASIDKECEVVAIKGRLPQSDVIDAVISADAMVGCTDQHYSRLALSDIASRYVVPAIDCSVRLEGADGRVGGQVLQLVRFLSDDACALCREMTLPQRVSQELMSLEEVARRKAGAARAAALGEQVDPYWQAAPQLNTVGYLTTIAGSMAAGYVIGWITGRFDPPFSRLQMNIGAPFFDVTDATTRPRPQCACSRMRGSADQGRADALIDAPEHWPPAVFL